MSADGSHLEFLIGTKNLTFVDVHPMNIHAMFALNQFSLLVSEEKFFQHIPIVSYVKTMSADGRHLEFPIGTKNITCVEVHPMIIHAMFALNWFTGFRGEIFFYIFPQGPMLKLWLLMAANLNFRLATKNISFCRCPSNEHLMQCLL